MSNDRRSGQTGSHNKQVLLYSIKKPRGQIFTVLWAGNVRVFLLEDRIDQCVISRRCSDAGDAGMSTSVKGHIVGLGTTCRDWDWWDL